MPSVHGTMLGVRGEIHMFYAMHCTLGLSLWEYRPLSIGQCPQIQQCPPLNALHYPIHKFISLSHAMLK